MTKELMTMQDVLHSRDIIENMGQGKKTKKKLAGIDNYFNVSIGSLEECIKKSKERLIAVASNE